VLRTTQDAPAKTKPRLLFFFRASEGASRRCEGYLAQVLQRRRNHQTFQISRVDISQRADLGERFRITDTPTILVIAHRKIRGRLVRPTGCEPIRETLQPWLR
jgi:hypothetical protein